MRLLPIAVLCLGLTACAGPEKPTADDDSLYQALGGQAGIALIVEGLLINISDNPRIVHHFEDTDIDRLHDMLIEQFCFEAGGPCEYTGDSMIDSHAGMQINEGEFNALVEDLVDAMQAQGVPVTAQNRLLARLAPMRGDIIYR